MRPRAQYGFFIPDVEYLADPEGLVTYLRGRSAACRLCRRQTDRHRERGGGENCDQKCTLQVHAAGIRSFCCCEFYVTRVSIWRKNSYSDSAWMQVGNCPAPRQNSKSHDVGRMGRLLCKK